MKKLTFYVFIVIMLFLTSCASSILPDVSISNSKLGDELKFPDGWVLVAMSEDKNAYTFVCERDNVYRFCTPEIVKVTK